MTTDTKTPKRWSKTDETKLLKDVSDGRDVAEIAVELGRTEGATVIRLKKLALDMIDRDKKTLEEVAQLVKLDEASILEHRGYQMKKTKMTSQDRIDKVKQLLQDCINLL